MASSTFSHAPPASLYTYKGVDLFASRDSWGVPNGGTSPGIDINNWKIYNDEAPERLRFTGKMVVDSIKFMDSCWNANFPDEDPLVWYLPDINGTGCQVISIDDIEDDTFDGYPYQQKDWWMLFYSNSAKFISSFDSEFDEENYITLNWERYFNSPTLYNNYYFNQGLWIYPNPQNLFVFQAIRIVSTAATRGLGFTNQKTSGGAGDWRPTGLTYDATAVSWKKEKSSGEYVFSTTIILWYLAIKDRLSLRQSFGFKEGDVLRVGAKGDVTADDFSRDIKLGFIWTNAENITQGSSGGIGGGTMYGGTMIIDAIIDGSITVLGTLTDEEQEISLDPILDLKPPDDLEWSTQTGTGGIGSIDTVKQFYGCFVFYCDPDSEGSDTSVTFAQVPATQVENKGDKQIYYRIGSDATISPYTLPVRLGVDEILWSYNYPQS